MSPLDFHSELSYGMTSLLKKNVNEPIILVTFLISTCPLHTISGCGKSEAHINCP